MTTVVAFMSRNEFEQPGLPSNPTHANVAALSPISPFLQELATVTFSPKESEFVGISFIFMKNTLPSTEGEDAMASRVV